MEEKEKTNNKDAEVKDFRNVVNSFIVDEEYYNNNIRAIKAAEECNIYNKKEIKEAIKVLEMMKNNSPMSNIIIMRSIQTVVDVRVLLDHYLGTLERLGYFENTDNNLESDITKN